MFAYTGTLRANSQVDLKRELVCKTLARAVVQRGELDGRGVVEGGAAEEGSAVQVDPIKSTLKAPGNYLLKVRYDGPLSTFAFKCKLRRYKEASFGDEHAEQKLNDRRTSASRLYSGRGLHSSTSQLNLSRF